MAKHGNTIWEHFGSRLPDGSSTDSAHELFYPLCARRGGSLRFQSRWRHSSRRRPDISGSPSSRFSKKGSTGQRPAYDSIHGPIETSWKLADGFVSLDVKIPANTKATVHIPGQHPSNITESGQPALQANGVKFLRMEDGHVLFELGSGSYRFRGIDQTFDLSQSPKNWLESQPILRDMLATGEKLRYSDNHPDNVLWVFRPENLKPGRTPPSRLLHPWGKLGR